MLTTEIYYGIIFVVVKICGEKKVRHSFFASVAQSVEQGTENPCVDGSIPSGGTTVCGSDSVVECHLAKVKVASSNLVFRSILKIKRRDNLRLFISFAAIFVTIPRNFA